MIRGSDPHAKAQDILINHWDGALPIDPEVIATKSGAVVTGLSGCDYSGKAYRKNSNAYIEYNKGDSSFRQRFAIAHALGHHALSHTIAGRVFIDAPGNYSTTIVDQEEAQANSFAIELLIPAIVLKHFVVTKGISSLTELSTIFSVSAVAMQYRIKKLGFL